MPRTIDLNREFQSMAVEVENVATDRVLATKFVLREPSPSQRLPESIFLGGRFVTQATRVAGGGGDLHLGRSVPRSRCHAPHPALRATLSRRERDVCRLRGA